MKAKELCETFEKIHDRKCMESNELSKLLEEIRISSYADFPFFLNEDLEAVEHGLCNFCGQEFVQGRVVVDNGNEVHVCKQCAGYTKAKTAKEVIKNFKINHKALDDYFSDENTKERIVERVDQAIAFSNKGSKSKSLYAGIFGALLAKNTGLFTYAHEMGHYGFLNSLFDTSGMKIVWHVDAFENFKEFLNEPSFGTFLNWILGLDRNHDKISGYLGIQNGSPFSADLTEIGESLGRDTSLGLFYGGGVIVESLICSSLCWTGLLAYVLGRKELGKGLMAFSTISQMSPLIYAITGSENIFAARCFGISPGMFGAILLSPISIAIGLAYLKHELDERKKKRREDIKLLIDKQKISLDEVFESFKNFDKNMEANSLEKELADRADWLFNYCERKEEKKTTKKIESITKKILKKYMGFIDFLATNYKDRIKEYNEEEKKREKGYFNADYISFKNELCYFGVSEKKIKKLYDMLHKSKNYEDFCIKKKKYELTEKFMKKASISPDDLPLNKVVSALGYFYKGSRLSLR